MKKVVVTGSEGFIGKNLHSRLNELEGYDIQTINRSTNESEYLEILNGAHIIYHLAGVNRPDKEAEFFTGNVELTQGLLDCIEELNGSPIFLLSSSVQAREDNPYGTSKQQAEEIVIKATESGIINGVIYRLPGVFGKWCKPNYNSVVATFCHNVARNLPIEVHDRSFELPLVYIDDVVGQFIEHLTTDPGHVKQYNKIRTQHNTSLGYLADTIQSFPKTRESLHLPKIRDSFVKKLYSTYLSYLPHDAFSYKMDLKVDDRGDLFEWIKSEDFGQIFVSTTKPGVTRGNHYHHTKTEKFLVIEGKAEICFRKINSEEVVRYQVNGQHPEVLDIPPGYTHNLKNVGNEDMITLFWANEIFDPENPDTFYLEV